MERLKDKFDDSLKGETGITCSCPFLDILLGVPCPESKPIKVKALKKGGGDNG